MLLTTTLPFLLPVDGGFDPDIVSFVELARDAAFRGTCLDPPRDTLEGR